ncbi:MAG: aminotransferase class I/II-fold pyridoxal phosphate-dependent enzyme, partial [Burkholderiales bacterium]|nr:aminotransferase class I/II-fold pyridoxal phosphate-dependent enzyme [Burkholderiales bacterium]
ASPARRKLILTDGVFSMDGDLAPLPQIVAAAERHDALVLVDDAHGFGVLGPDGAGTLAYFGIDSPRVLQMGTLGKAAGVHGAFVAGPDAAIRWLAQRARSYVFATATPPMLAAAVRASLQLMRDEPDRRARVVALGARLRDGLARTGASRVGHWLPSASAVHALVLGDNAVAMATMRALWDRGLWVPAIRPPTVPAGTARLRVSLTAAHTDAQVDRLVDALAAVLPCARAAA